MYRERRVKNGGWGLGVGGNEEKRKKLQRKKKQDGGWGGGGGGIEWGTEKIPLKIANIFRPN